MKRFFFRAGMSLVEVVVAIGVGSIGLMAVLKIAEVIKQSGRSSEIRQDLQQVVSTIRSNLSCQQTFISYGTTRPIPCNGSVILKNKSGIPLLNNSKLADWTIEAKCEVLGGKNGLSMYASKLKANATTSIDPLTGKAYDQTNSLSMLFKADVRPCQDYFGNSIITFKNCGSNEYLKGIDFDTRELNCLPMSSCPNKRYFNGVDSNGNPICESIAQVILNGGSFQVRPFNTSFCRSINPSTGTCSCPNGYSPLGVSEFAAYPPGLVPPDHAFYCDGNYSRPEGCGYISYICIPN